MRISVMESDPKFNRNISLPVAVFLDGERLDNCFTADEELGIAYCWATDDIGRFIIDPNNRKTLLTIEKHGVVDISFKE